MSPVLDHILVAAALIASVAYAWLSLGPRGWRRKALTRLAVWAARTPLVARFHGFARRLEAAAGRSSAACGGCDGCADGAAPPGGGAPAGSEIKVPVGHIGRRR